MATITKSAPLVALMALAIFAPTAAQAQDQRLRVSFAPAVATVSGDAELALGGTVGYRFSERFWFEGELTWIDAGAAGFGERILGLDTRTVNASGHRRLGAARGRWVRTGHVPWHRNPWPSRHPEPSGLPHRHRPDPRDHRRLHDDRHPGRPL